MAENESIDSIHSVKSIESICSDGCPVSPSVLYDQRAFAYEMRKNQQYRKSMTFITNYRYRKSQSIVGKGSFVWPRNEITIQNNIDSPRKIKTEKIRNIQPFFHKIQHKPLEMISICL